MRYPLTSHFDRVPLAHAPTPFEPLPRLSAFLGGPAIYVKRDDCTGLAFGGNKTRKLEFLMAEALAAGADTVITTGGVQSNHVRQTIAAAARLGLKSEVVLRRVVSWPDAAYAASGNVLLDRLLGAAVHILDANADAAATMEEIAARVRRQGAKPYVVPLGGSNAVGALGYVRSIEEITAQAEDAGLNLTHVVHAAGSGGTQAGLAAGLAALDSPARLVSIAVLPAAAELGRQVADIVPGVMARLKSTKVVAPAHLAVNGDYAGPAYGQPTPAMIEAVTETARREGLLLDPVYTGKAMAGLFALVRSGELGRGHTVVFLHSGGAPGLFAYPSLFDGSDAPWPAVLKAGGKLL